MANHTLAQNLTRLNKAREDIADAIVARGGSASHIDGLESMPTSIQAIPNQYAQADNGKVVSNGALVSQTSTTATTNGTIDTTTNDEVVVSVPNTYAAGDEGKVVQSGALVAQTATTTTTNGTIDTTTNNSIVVNVANSYVAADEGKVVSNGALVAQGSDEVTENGTVDTTLISSLLVNVQGGGGLSQIVKLTTNGYYVSSDSELFIAETENYFIIFGVCNNKSSKSQLADFFIPDSFDFSAASPSVQRGCYLRLSTGSPYSLTFVFSVVDKKISFGSYPSKDSVGNAIMLILGKST